MLNNFLYILTFVGIGVVGWFPPTSTFPSPQSHICSTNTVPVGAQVWIYYDRTKRGIGCEVVGNISISRGHIIDVSRGMRDYLGFQNTTVVRVYRNLGTIPPCAGASPPPDCGKPPAACEALVPKPALDVCVK